MTWQMYAGRPWKVTELLAIGVDHQRAYFERSLPPFFWLDEREMYRASPLLSRPAEIIAVLKGEEWRSATALVPGPRPMSMTSSIFGPPADQLSDAPKWMRQYLVFLVPRPWTLWSLYLPRELRPGNTALMTTIGCVLSLVGLGAAVRTAGRVRAE